jgi:hypothetical protein
MDKFLTYAGKQPVYLGDIDFMQSAFSGAFLNLLKAYTGLATPTAILFGCEITYANNAISWTDGVVCLAGEILPIAAGIVGGEAGPGYFDIVSTSGGTRTFGDGDSHDCWEERAATITKTSTGYPIANIRRINPVEMFEAREYRFSGISNDYSTYAKLTDVGGALHLDLRRPAMAESGTIAFQANAVGLPSAWITKLSAGSAPTSVLALALISGDAPSATIVAVSWDATIGRNEVKVTVTLTGNTTQILAAFEVHCVIPVFS